MSYVVFIQIHGEANKLVKCLESLVNQSVLPSKIVIVDDGTPDGSVSRESITWIRNNIYPSLETKYFGAVPPKKSNLDTVGIAIFHAWIVEIWDQRNMGYEFLAIIDVDSFPEKTYYEKVIDKMNNDSDLICASGVIHIGNQKEELISAKVIKRKDARGSGKVIRIDFLRSIPFYLFPEIAWDTWINTKAKIANKKAHQIPGIILHSSRPTTRLINRDNFRDGRLTYHMGYNPLLLLYKIIFRGFDVWKGYRDAQKKKWKLPDSEVRKYFGWRYFLHILK